MRLPLSLVLLTFSCLAFAQLSAETLPEYRPALLGHHPRSLVNLINTDALMKHGQRDAIVMFSCGVTTLGDAGYSNVYRGSANSELLKDEVLGRIKQAQFEPAIYKHNRVDVFIDGTVSFFIVNGKPHLRIFLNQEENELTTGKDFVAPQLAFVPGNVKWKGIYWPPGAPGHEGIASVTLDIDGEGKVHGVKVAYEHPAGMGFGAQTASAIPDALFIPGFRNGKAVPCRFTSPFIFPGPGRFAKTG